MKQFIYFHFSSNAASIGYKHTIQNTHTMEIGGVFEGMVTQSGTMSDKHTFRAVQHCRLEIKGRCGHRVDCEITRTEKQKFVDGQAEPSKNMPFYLRQYLKTLGQCRERACGVFYADGGGFLLLDGAEPECTILSEVTWSPHRYNFVLKDDQLVGVAVNMSFDDDRENDLGLISLKNVTEMQ